MTLIVATVPASITADLGRRRMRGTAVPWGTEAVVSSGRRVRFLPGSVDLTGVPVVLHHDEGRPFGVVEAADTTETGQDVTVAVSKVDDGDEALVLAADGVLTGWSVGVEPTEATEEDGVLVVAASEARHLALVTVPAFTAARVVDVAASRPTGHPTEKEEPPVTVTAPTPEETPAVVAAAPRAATPALPLPTVGQYLYAAAKDRALLAEYRAAVAAAAPHTLTSDTPGLIPVPILGPVVSDMASARPILSAFGPAAGPEGGVTFKRPVVSDHLSDAAAAAEKSDVTDQLTVTAKDVTYSFVKRAANLSAEVLAFTSPDVLDVTVRDLARAYARGTEKVAATYLAGLGGTGTAVTGGAEVEVLYSAAADIFSAVGVLPDVLVVSPDVWANLGGLTATDGRPLFPVLGPSNAAGSSAGVTSFGMNVLGLRVVVSWALAPASCFLVASPFFETYEAHRVNMRADEPTILGLALGIGGAAAAVLTESGALVKLTGL